MRKIDIRYEFGSMIPIAKNVIDSTAGITDAPAQLAHVILHSLSKVPIWRGDNHVEVVVHEHVRMDPKFVCALYKIELIGKELPDLRNRDCKEIAITASNSDVIRTIRI